MLSYDPDDHTRFMCVEICTYDTYLTICLNQISFVSIPKQMQYIVVYVIAEM